MSRNDPVESRVVRRVLTRAMGDAAYRRTLLEYPNEVMRFELARVGGPVPDIQFHVVEETEKTWVVRVPVSTFERRAQKVLKPLFEFVDSASKADLDRFVRAPKKKIEELLGIELEKDMDVVVRIESYGQRVLVVPQDEFGPISANSALAPEARIKLCPKGCSISSDICPAGNTFGAPCPCTISCTVTPDFPTIPQVTAAPPDSVKKLLDLLDDE